MPIYSKQKTTLQHKILESIFKNLNCFTQGPTIVALNYKKIGIPAFGTGQPVLSPPPMPGCRALPQLGQKLSPEHQLANKLGEMNRKTHQSPFIPLAALWGTITTPTPTPPGPQGWWWETRSLLSAIAWSKTSTELFLTRKYTTNALGRHHSKSIIRNLAV